ncbi:hypothetical protein ACHAXH_005386 [Discostella pseudostelligera]
MDMDDDATNDSAAGAGGDDHDHDDDNMRVAVADESLDVVPGTQLSQHDDSANANANDDDDDDGDGDGDGEPTTPMVPSSSRRRRRGGLFSTPAKERANRGDAMHDDDGGDDDDNNEDVVAETPAATRVPMRGVPDDDLVEEILSSVRKPRQVAGAAGGAGGDGDDDDENDNWNNGGGGGGGGSVRSSNRSRSSRSATSAAAADDNNVNDGNAAGDEDDENNNGGGADDDIGDENNETTEDPTTLIRGTDVHVQSAAAAFCDFILNFVSVEESERRIAKERKRKLSQRRRRRVASGAGAGGGGGDSDGEDDGMGDTSRGGNSWDIPSDSEEENEGEAEGGKTPLYLHKLEQILLRGHSDSTQDSLVSSAAGAGSSRVGVASLDLDALHLYFHSPECQRVYGWLVDYPSEIVPLMDILLGRELENLRDKLRLRQEELLSEAEANDDVEGVESAKRILELLPNDVLPRVQVRPFHLRSLSHMRSLDPNAIDTLLCIRGMVVRTSPVIPDLKVAFFQCSICGNTDQVTIDRGRIAEPTQCPTCFVRHGYSLIHNRCYYSDKQMVRVQETPDEVPAGETPASIVVFAYDDLVDAVRPGDRVEVTGVFRAQARRVNPKITKVKSVYKTYVDAVHFRKVATNSSSDRDAGAAAQSKKEKVVDEEQEGTKKENQQQGKRQGDDVTHGSRFPPERIAELLQLSQQPDVYDQLVKALAPSIWEMDDVKKGVLCMLFGGNSRKVKKGTAERKRNRERARQARRELIASGDIESDNEEPELEDDDEEAEDGLKLNKRGDINILLVGDPGTSKSQLLGYVHKLSPRGVYTSGKGSSAVGLTASVVRDPETRELVMESGALVLSDLGICCIDEFDKMSGTTRAILHEAMEQQTVSIAKAGIIATLNARTSILASANPVESRYNPSLSVVENIQLPPTLLSRFDLIYLILDAPNVSNDRMLAQHLVGLYYETPNVVQPPLDHSLLRDYIAYARENIHPELSDLATRELIAAYIEMRRGGSGGSGSGRGRTITATPRQLESLIRLSEALARMKFSTVVTRDNVKEAVRLMKVATQAAATDPRTGRIDMDMITTGRSTAERELEENLSASLKELLVERRGNRIGVSEIRRQLSEIMNVTVQQEDLIEIIKVMDADGLVQYNERAQTVFVRAGVIG